MPVFACSELLKECLPGPVHILLLSELCDDESTLSNFIQIFCSRSEISERPACLLVKGARGGQPVSVTPKGT